MKRILIVDDSQLVRTILKDTLQKSGYEVIETDNGYSAYNLTIEELPDLVILDLVMPELNGFDVTKKIRTDDRTKHIPIIISTGSEGMHAEFNKDSETFVQGFIEKPYKTEIIVKRIKKILGEEI